MEKSVRVITVATFALLGALSISSGILYSNLENNHKQKTVLVVVQRKQISKETQPEIKLKNFELEVNTPLSVKIVDYLDSIVSDEVLANLKLDTSTVNMMQPGSYSYRITYKKKVYTGTIIVKEKQPDLNTMQTITLKSINIKLGTALPTDIANYLVETVSEEVKATMKLDTSEVNTQIAATYQYRITYHNSIYTGTITVTEDQPTLSTETPNKKDTTTENTDHVMS